MIKGKADGLKMRLFDEHKKRKTVSLNGIWSFLPDPENKGKSEGWQKGLRESFKAEIPSVWNIQKGLLDYEGAVWYEKRFNFEGGAARICFEAVMTEASVWLDGELLGTHYGGFTAFSYLIPSLTLGEHCLVVCVSNKFDERSIPQRRVDWFNCGGIIRDVYVERLEGIVILSNKFSYTLSEDLKTAVCFGETELYNAETTPITDEVLLKVGEKSVSTEIHLCGGERRKIKTNGITLEGIKLWDEASPKLYFVSAETKTDDLIDRVGLRKVEVLKDGIYLNRRKIRLNGVNRHEYYPGFGFSVPFNLEKRDLDIITEMGCNSIRGSHYPNAKQFLDLLDENGILFWSEIPIWGCGFSPEALGDSLVLERGLNMHHEMVEQYYNHPSIIIWGMHNEIRSDTKEGYNMSRLYYNYLKENGGNRIVTFASNQSMGDICFEFCDVIAVNRYIGWYDDHLTWEEFLVSLEEYCDRLGYNDKPIIIGEFGAAAIYGNHTFDNIPWTEEYQASLIEKCLELFRKDERISGTYIWQFCDIRTTPIGLDRARGYNNKGLVNEHRKPKSAYYTAKRIYRGEKQ